MVAGTGGADDKCTALGPTMLAEHCSDGAGSQVDLPHGQYYIVVLAVTRVERDRSVRVVVCPPTQPRHVRWEIRGQERPVDRGAVSGSMALKSHHFS